MGKHEYQLSEMEKRYCMGRARNLTPKIAALEAGYSEKSVNTTVARLKKRDRIKDEIDRLKLKIALDEGDQADIKEVKQFLTSIMRSGGRDAKSAADSLKDLHIREKGNDNGDPKAFYMASLTECDVLADIAKNKPPINVMMGNYQPNVGGNAEDVER